MTGQLIGNLHLARFELTPGQAGDVKWAAELLEGLPVQTVMADTAYDAAHLIDPLHERGVTTAIPSHPTRKHPRPLDKHLYRSRNLVEAALQRIEIAFAGRGRADDEDHRHPVEIGIG